MSWRDELREQRPCFNLLVLKNMPILEQLRLEEALLRTDEENWCLINHGSNPSIVMGISGKPELLINKRLFKENPVPLIRRFSGGGTVCVDPNTCFVTWICNSSCLNVPPFPHKVFLWSENFYKSALGHLPYQLLENDYVLGDKKIGGNAQYMCKNRWLHHTSFLWDYDKSFMDYLLKPPKMPGYRKERDHHTFLCKLKDFFSSQKDFTDNILEALKSFFHIKETNLEFAKQKLTLPHRKATIELPHDW